MSGLDVSISTTFLTELSALSESDREARICEFASIYASEMEGPNSVNFDSICEAVKEAVWERLDGCHSMA